MSLAAVTGHVLLVSACLLFLIPVRRLSPLPRGVALAVCLGIGLARIGELRLIAYPAGILGDLSITTQILLAAVIAKRVADVEGLANADRSFLLTATAWTGLVLYFFSSGLTTIDVYAMGFGSAGLMLVLPIAILLCWRHRPGAAIAVVVGVVAYDFDLLSSRNIWDYLVDPLLVIFSWGWALTRALGRFRSSAASPNRP